MMNIFVIFFVTVLFPVISVCQVVYNVSIVFSFEIYWIQPMCAIPISDSIPYDFNNETSVFPNYNLICSGPSFSGNVDMNRVSCMCTFIDNVQATVSPILACRGFILSSSSNNDSESNLVWIILGSAVSIILVIILLVILISVLLLWIFVRKKKKSKKQYVANQERKPVVHEIYSNAFNQPKLPSLPEYVSVNFNDYEFIDEETGDLSSYTTYVDHTDELYQVIRKTKPVGINEGLYATVEDQISRIRTNPSNVNMSGRKSCIVVPTLEQRKDINNFIETSSLNDVRFSSNDQGDNKTSNEGIYWDPSEDIEDLYGQMSKEKLLEINNETISTLEKLGSGEFGEVSKGVWESPVGNLNVALKVLNNDTGDQSQTSFLQEAAILGQFSHPNILRLVGVVTLTAPNMIVTELMQEELKRFLDALQTQHNQELDYETLAPHFLSFSRQVASGMQHLAEKGCIHRDIAARNILLTDKCVCKIADFGMSRRLGTESDYYRVKGSNKLPVKWSAPEAIFFKRYTLKSDIWSYGMLLYEIWSVGRKPWPYEDNRSTVEKIARGVNLPPPAGCPRAIYELMVSTWHPKANQRPDMKDLVSVLSESDESLLARNQLGNRSGSTAPAFMLGSDPMAAEELYKDLQSKFLNVKN